MIVKKTNLFLLKLFFAVVLVTVSFSARQWFVENFSFNVLNKEGNQKEYIIQGGLTRSYIVHLPSHYRANDLLPLVFVLHGVATNADITMKITGMNDISDRENFIAVYPNGTGLFSEYVLSWNAGDCCNLVAPFGVDDVVFIKSIIEKLSEKYNINRKEIYAAGLSNGAMMAYRLGCELSDEIAAIAPVAGSMAIDVCHPESFVSVLAFHGENDEVVPFGGGSSSRFYAQWFDLKFRSVSDSVSFWVKNNGCLLGPQEFSYGDISKEVYFGCKNNTEVILFTFKNQGHVWPGGEGIKPFYKKDSGGIIASEVIWDFFKNHPKY
ncbi:polyhydroxybutyrate depolymerase [Patescibacteria group bacterium]|nr:polyhydroxybutyrate depolymerase [Patescibacteria group bacterium]